jgi:hypothetical protein
MASDPTTPQASLSRNFNKASREKGRHARHVRSFRTPLPLQTGQYLPAAALAGNIMSAVFTRYDTSI